jgi:hypothetical protein
LAADLPPAAVAFQRTANAMAAAAAAMPATVAYDVRAHVHYLGDQEYRYHYEVDRRAVRATVRVDDGPPPTESTPWPLDPTFDAFARFSTSGFWESKGLDELRFANDPRLLQYDLTKRAGVDAVSFAVKDYKIAYGEPADPQSPLLRLELTASPAAEGSQTVFRSVVVDPATWLPVQVTMQTPVGHSMVTLDYGRAGGHPVVTHFDIRKTERVLLVQMTASTEAWFENVRFDQPPAAPQ